MKYIVSLTTIPSKWDTLHLTLDSLLQQTLLPIAIVIQIPLVYSLRFSGAEISPEQMDSLQKKYAETPILFHRVAHDYGPGTKLVGLFLNDAWKHRVENERDTFVLLVDDDFIYQPYMIDYFDKCVHLNGNIEVASYYVYRNRIKVGQGADGFFIRLPLLSKFMDYFRVLEKEDYLLYHDDMYISYYFFVLCKLIHEIRPPHKGEGIYLPHAGSAKDALFFLEGKYARNQLNPICLQILDRLFQKNQFHFLTQI
jgi:hypothetical protein